MRQVMNKTLAVSLLLMLAGCEGYYRYPCQDPANWGKLECNNDVCQAEGTCTSIVLARSGTLPENSQDTDMQNSDTLEESSINTTCTASEELAVPTSYQGKGDAPRNFGVKNYIIQRPGADEQDSQPAAEQDSEPGEQPLTMNTVVDTAAHNAATR